VRSADPKNWLLIKHRDPFAAQREVTEQDRSVLQDDGRRAKAPAGAESRCITWPDRHQACQRSRHAG
jgi:hypothetical protein